MKCPACGYDPNTKKKPAMEVIQMLSRRGDKCIKALKEVSNKIMTGIPSDNSYFKYYLFLRGITILRMNISLLPLLSIYIIEDM